MSNLKLEVGREYVTRDGRVVRITDYEDIAGLAFTGRFGSTVMYYNREGQFLPNETNPQDIVALAAPASPTAAASVSGDANVEAVRAKLSERAAVGLRKYGVSTERGDLSPEDWLRHLQEELLDAAVYIEAHLSARSQP